MRIVAEPRPARKQKHQSKVLAGAMVAVMGAGLLTWSWMVAADRYAPRPWGLDSPAGRCVVCHSLERGGPFRVAPNLWGVVGAQKAWARQWFAYSPALLKKGGVWSETDLDQFLADANGYLPGTTKSIRVEDPEERRQIIDYLKQLSD